MGSKCYVIRLIIGISFFFIFAFTSTLAFSEVVELSASEDTYVDSRRNTKSYGSNSYIRLRESRKRDRQGLMKFDLTDVPRGSEIDSAKLLVYVTYRRTYNNTLSVHEALGDWDESTSWKNSPQMSDLSEDIVQIDAKGIYYELDLTDLVQDWVSGAAENNGVYLIISSGHIYINSSENSSNQPILNINYNTSRVDLSPVQESQQEASSEEPINTIQPHPNQESEPTPDLDAGVSDAPLYPSDKRLIIVAKDGSGDYGSIQPALNRSKPGDTIQVKDGIYVERVNFTVKWYKAGADYATELSRPRADN